ncbi:hypothetical protein EDD15DRAFT_2372232 [Pisolithus albus]|nr:hypothetical protein EDD15DRAFT_2372232 [Pisolithus albus]
MPQQVEHATVMTLDSITEDDVGRKLRVAGRMLTYDPESTFVLLQDACSALLVDASLCINLEVMHSVFDSSSDHSKSPTGWLAMLKLPDQLPIPILPACLPAPDINPSILMHALIISPAKDLDMLRLHAALMEMTEVPPTPYPL